MEILKPAALKIGDTIGIFTPSSPGYEMGPSLFENALHNLQKLGFKVQLGSVTEKRLTQGYRSATAPERAEEFMELIENPKVNGLLATIGGSNSSSLIPHLNFEKIRRARKVICGFSDITSLHLSILKYSGLQTFYGPTAMCWFGEWPDGIPESNEWFLQACVKHVNGERKITKSERWSNHMRSWSNGDWKTLPREWKKQNGWNILRQGKVEAPIIAVNLNTLMSAAGTPYFPDLRGKILLLEDMSAGMGLTERHLRQLQLMGAFNGIVGLIIGKPEVFSLQGAPFSYEDLFLEILGAKNIPILAGFDCSHTNPMITVPQMAKVRLSLQVDAEFSFLEGSIE